LKSNRNRKNNQNQIETGKKIIIIIIIESDRNGKEKKWREK